MRILLLFFLFISINVTAQFGFERIDTIQVIKNSITQKYPWAGGIDYGQFSNIDFNYDGVQDLFVFDRTCHKVLTFIQNGMAGIVDYEYAPEYESLFPEMTNWALLADYDCDGDKDIFTYTIGGARVYRNNGNATNGLSFVLQKSILKTNIYGNDVFMYVSSVDVPAIVDIDNDGDLDILAFGVGGSSVEYQRNMSIETYGVCDSLNFVTGNVCWGLFKEASSSNTILLNEPCPGQVGTPYMEVHGDDVQNQDRHAGSTVLALDMNANGVMDLVLGDISYNTLTLLMNGGAAPNLNSAMISQDNAFPSNTTSVNQSVFPAGYHVDINNDGKRDLLVSPASTIGSENEKSVMYYSNSGADNAPVFNYEQSDFLQGNMIEFGSGSYPVFFDQNGDGLKDLLVSIQGKFDATSGNQISKIAYYENTGTASSPQYTFVTDDFQNLSVLGISTGLNFYPTFGDLDGDGDEDMVLGEYSGYNYLFFNTGGPGNQAIFNTYTVLEESDGTLIMDGVYPIPQLVDIDRDGDTDLVLGKRNGKLNFYKNIGTPTAYEFKLYSNFLGGVNVTEAGFVEGRAVPVFVDIDNEYQLVVGSKEGNLFHYDDIENNLELNFNLLSVNVDNVNIGTQSAPAITSLSNDNKLVMMLGNKRGGLGLYKSAVITDVSLQELKLNFSIYPNPSNGNFIIESNVNQLNSEIEVIDIYGKLIYTDRINSNQKEINLTDLSPGIYLVTLTQNGISTTKKIIFE
jgi:hypothetical protein